MIGMPTLATPLNLLLNCLNLITVILETRMLSNNHFSSKTDYTQRKRQLIRIIIDLQNFKAKPGIQELLDHNSWLCTKS